MSLLDTLTGGASEQANLDLEQALQAIQQVKAPSVEDMQFQIQKLVQAGVLTPAKAQFYLANPSAFQKEVIPQLGTQAQESAVGTLLSDASAGGISPAEEAATQDVIRKLNTTEKGQRDAILQNAAARGTLTGGETMAAQLEGNQTDVSSANEEALKNAATAQELALQELTSAGTMGAGLQGQENTQANTVAAATDAINKFNAAQEQGTENFNVQNENAAEAANLENLQRIGDTNVGAANVHAEKMSQLPQEVYQDALAKAQAEAGIKEAQAGQATGQGQQQLDILGGGIAAATAPFAAPYVNIVNPAAGSTTAAGAQPNSGVMTGEKGGLVEYLESKYGKPDAPPEEKINPVPGPEISPDIYVGKDGRNHATTAMLAGAGGKVPGDGRKNAPGDSPRNDRIPAMLSKDEIVLPRSVSVPAMRGNDDKVMEFLNRMRKPKMPPHPDDVATVLHALGKVREVA